MKDHPLRILHINSYYVSRELYKNIYDYQQSIGCMVRVFVPVRKGRNPAEFDRGDYTDLSFDFFKTDRYFFHIKHAKILKDIKTRYDGFQYDIMHAHTLFSNGYIAYRIKKEYGLPYIVTVRNSDVNTFFKYAFHLRRLGRQIMEEAEMVIFLSETYKEYVLNTYVDKKRKDVILKKSVVLTNGIDEFWFRNIAEGPRNIREEKKLNLISVGTIDKNKNHETVLNVVKRLREEGYLVKWKVIGKIVDEKIYRRLIRSEAAEYESPMPKEKLREEYARSDILVMPSVTESFGLAYAEAMTQGVPVIYTKGQGFDRQFPDGTVGYPVECYDIEGIGNAIKSIVEDYPRLSANCIEYVGKFRWNHINEKYMEIFNKISNR